MKRVHSDVAYEFVRKNIVNGKYPPGYSLLVNELATEVGVSRTPVKDALRQLEADGLVVIKTRLGAKVRTMGENEFREMCELRLALESYAASLAAKNRTKGDMQAIEAALESMIKVTEKMQANSDALFSDLLQGDVRFHITILSAAKNELIKSEILRLHVLNRVISQPLPVQPEGDTWKETLQHTIDSHKEICDAIRNADESGARDAMSKHIQEIIDDHAQFARDAKTVAARKLTEEELSYMAQIPR